MNAIKSVVAKLETELHEKSTNVSFLEAEIRTLQRKLQMKDAEIAKQERELHKLRVSKWYFVTKIVLTYCTVRKNYCSDRDKLLKLKAEGREFAKCLRSLEQFIQTVKGQKVRTIFGN